MCDASTMMMMAVSAGGQVAQGNAARRQGDAMGAEYDRQALYERDTARAEAQRIRRAGESAQGQTVAALASSGVKLGEGSAGMAEQQVAQDYLQDEYMAVLTGERRAGASIEQGRQVRKAGRAARTAAYIGAGTSLISSGAAGMRASGGTLKGWDAGRFNGTNDRGRISAGSNQDWFLRNGRGAD
jgi:hypothetical protein